MPAVMTAILQKANLVKNINILSTHSYCAAFNPILLKLFRAIDSSTAGLQKPTNLTICNSKTA